MNREKHECSLLKVVSDAGSTPAASTIVQIYKSHWQLELASRAALPIFT